MSLQPIAVEFCQASSLRGRRRSFIDPKDILPLLSFTSGAAAPNQDESAVANDVFTPESPSTDGSSPPPNPISPISSAHMSSHSSSFTTLRHHDTLSTVAVSPSTTAVSSESCFESKAASVVKDSRLKWRLASALFQYFLNGWGDGVTGTALPYFQARFHLSYMTSSLLFAGTMCGFTLGTLLVTRSVNFLGRFYLSSPKLALQPLTPFRLLFSRSSRNNAIGFSACQARFLALMITSVAAPTNFVMMGSQKGLPTMFIAYVIISYARAVSTASLNLFLSETPSKLGYAFGAWGMGAVVSPLVFQVTAAAGLPWPHFYFGSLILVAANTTFLAITFMPTAQELTADRKKAVVQTACDGYFKAQHADILDVSSPTSTPPPVKSPLRLTASMPYQWAVSGYVLFYCGTETTIQGLVVQFLLAERSANPHTVGYISSGFWMGISISRTAWSYFSPRISFTTRKHIIQVCLGAALSMLILLWFIHSIPENGVFVSLIGLLFGPIFPACLELGNDLLPVEVNMISMAIVSAAGSMGSAIFPFITGVITTKYSMRCWSYITLTQVTILFGTWYLFPTRQPLRRTITL